MASNRFSFLSVSLSPSSSYSFLSPSPLLSPVLFPPVFSFQFELIAFSKFNVLDLNLEALFRCSNYPILATGRIFKLFSASFLQDSTTFDSVTFWDNIISQAHHEHFLPHPWSQPFLNRFHLVGNDI